MPYLMFVMKKNLHSIFFPTSLVAPLVFTSLTDVVVAHIVAVDLENNSDRQLLVVRALLVRTRDHNARMGRVGCDVLEVQRDLLGAVDPATGQDPAGNGLVRVVPQRTPVTKRVGFIRIEACLQPHHGSATTETNVL